MAFTRFETSPRNPGRSARGCRASGRNDRAYSPPTLATLRPVRRLWPRCRRSKAMSVFGMIKDAIFGAVGSAQAQAVPSGAQPGAGQGPAMPQFGSGQAQVDVEQVLVQRAQGKGNPDLNWRSSIVDL